MFTMKDPHYSFRRKMVAILGKHEHDGNMLFTVIKQNKSGEFRVQVSKTRHGRGPSTI